MKMIRPIFLPHRFLVCFPGALGLDPAGYMASPQASLLLALLESSLSRLRSALTVLCQAFFGLPAGWLPSISNRVVLFTQSSSSFLSTWPNHLSLALLTTSMMLYICRFSRSSLLVKLSFSETPFIHLTILFSDLSSMVSSQSPCLCPVCHARSDTC